MGTEKAKQYSRSWRANRQKHSRNRNRHGKYDETI